MWNYYDRTCALPHVVPCALQVSNLKRTCGERKMEIAQLKEKLDEAQATIAQLSAALSKTQAKSGTKKEGAGRSDDEFQNAMALLLDLAEQSVTRELRTVGQDLPSEPHDATPLGDLKAEDFTSADWAFMMSLAGVNKDEAALADDHEGLEETTEEHAARVEKVRAGGHAHFPGPRRMSRVCQGHCGCVWVDWDGAVPFHSADLTRQVPSSLPSRSSFKSCAFERVQSSCSWEGAAVNRVRLAKAPPHSLVPASRATPLLTVMWSQTLGRPL